MKIHPVVLAVLLSAASGAWRIAAQSGPEVQHERGSILSAGLGAGSNDFGVLASITFRRDALLLGMRMAGTGSLDFFGPQAQVFDSDIALLAGRQFRRRAGYVSLVSGLALVQSNRPGAPRKDCDGSWVGALFCGNEVVKRRTVGVPLEAKAVLSSRHVGIGLAAFGNLNTRASFGGVALVFELGELR